MRFTTLALSLCLASPAFGHPHVFVDVRGSFVLDEQGTLESVRIYWLYDDFSTLVLMDILGLDPDGDGALDDAELKKVAEGETGWDAGYEGDTYLYIDGEKTQLSRPKGAYAEAVENRIGVGFTLDLQTPVQMQGHQAVLDLYDPMYYFAYTVMTDSHVEGPLRACDFEVVPFVFDESTFSLQQELAQLGQEEMPENPNVGAKLAEKIKLTCP